MSNLEAVAYRHDETALTGWLARPDQMPRGAIVLYPTIVNANAAMQRRARMLADKGFIVLIADLYGTQPESFDAAQELAAQLRADNVHYRRRLAAALQALIGLEDAAALPRAVIGYCLGGQAALEMARDGQEIVAAVSFHGLLQTDAPARPGAVKARLLICHGDADPMVPRADVLSLWDEMDHAGADWHFHAYSGVKHGFTDPASDERNLAAVAYDASADRQSWAAMLLLFEELFG